MKIKQLVIKNKFFGDRHYQPIGHKIQDTQIGVIIGMSGALFFHRNVCYRSVDWEKDNVNKMDFCKLEKWNIDKPVLRHWSDFVTMNLIEEEFPEIKILDIYHPFKNRAELHLGYGDVDCLHWCYSEKLWDLFWTLWNQSF